MKLKTSLLVASLFFSSWSSFASTEEWMKTAVNEQYNDAVQIRRDIHQHAELGNQEFRTQKVVVDFLKKTGYRCCHRLEECTYCCYWNY